MLVFEMLVFEMLVFEMLVMKGGCGSCVVALTKQDLITKKEKTIAVNSVRFNCKMCNFHVTVKKLPTVAMFLLSSN